MTNEDQPEITEDQLLRLQVLAEPTTRQWPLLSGDRQAISAALAEIRRLSRIIDPRLAPASVDPAASRA